MASDQRSYDVERWFGVKLIVTYDKNTLNKFGHIKRVAIKEAKEAYYMRRAAYNAGRNLLTPFRNTVTNWDHPVKFNLRTSAVIGSERIFFIISTHDQVWNWLDQGTKTMWVYSDPEDPYIAKTVPTVFGSGLGGGHLLWAGFPLPGIEARRWTTDGRTKRTAAILLKYHIEDQFKKFRRSLENA